MTTILKEDNRDCEYQGSVICNTVGGICSNCRRSTEGKTLVELRRYLEVDRLEERLMELEQRLQEAEEYPGKCPRSSDVWG